MSQRLIAQPILDAFWQAFSPPTREKRLAILWGGDNPDSAKYVQLKQQNGGRYGVATELHHLPNTVSQEEVIAAVQELNARREVDAFIVQLPLPARLDREAVLAAIAPEKDVDNLTGGSEFVSPMVRAVDAILVHYALDLSNKTCAVVGMGVLAGQPIFRYLTDKGYAATPVDKDTPHADEIIEAADVVFGCTGQANRIHEGNTREGQIIFDCSGHDVDVRVIKQKAAAFTPATGAIGPLTVHFLFLNVLKS